MKTAKSTDITERAVTELHRLMQEEKLPGSLAKAAEKLEINPCTLSYWEKGMVTPFAESIARLVKFGADAEYILIGEREKAK